MTDQEKLAEIAGEVQKLMPQTIELNSLASLVLTICYGYLDTKDVPEFLRACVAVVEENKDEIQTFMADEP